MIYCGTVNKATRLANVLGCLCYHRNVGSAEEKSKILDQLTKGSNQVFTATNALGLGVDAPSIRAVMHWGFPRSLRDYAQESGRAGRDGEKSEAVILAGQTVSNDMEVEMAQYLQTKACRRAVLDSVMDGREDREGCEEGEERCDLCGGNQTQAVVVEEGEEEEGERELEQLLRQREFLAQQEKRLQREEMTAVQRFEEKLQEISQACAWCKVSGKTDSGHRLEECPRESAKSVREGVKYMQKEIVWEKYSGCFECGLPQTICNRWEESGDGGSWARGREGCQFSGVLIRSVASIWVGAGEELEEWVAEQGGDINNKFIKWMGQKVKWGELETNRMCLVFNRFTE